MKGVRTLLQKLADRLWKEEHQQIQQASANDLIDKVKNQEDQLRYLQQQRRITQHEREP